MKRIATFLMLLCTICMGVQAYVNPGSYAIKVYGTEKYLSPTDWSVKGNDKVTFTTTARPAWDVLAGITTNTNAISVPGSLLTLNPYHYGQTGVTTVGCWIADDATTRGNGGDAEWLILPVEGEPGAYTIKNRNQNCYLSYNEKQSNYVLMTETDVDYATWFEFEDLSTPETPLLTIGCVSDVHCMNNMITPSSGNLDDITVRSSLTTVLNRMKTEDNPDVLIFGGDSESDKTIPEANSQKVRQVLAEAMRGVFQEGKNPNVLWITGNHDYEVANYDKLPKPYNAGNFYDFPMKQDIGMLSDADVFYEDVQNGDNVEHLLAAYHYVLNGFDFVVLNCGKYFFEYAWNYTYSTESANWVKNKLAEIDPDGTKTVFFLSHVPFPDSNSLNSGKGMKTEEGYSILKEACAAHPNLIMLYGHDHGQDSAYIREKTSQRVTLYNTNGSRIATTDANHVDGTTQGEVNSSALMTTGSFYVTNNGQHLIKDSNNLNLGSTATTHTLSAGTAANTFRLSTSSGKYLHIGGSGRWSDGDASDFMLFDAAGKRVNGVVSGQAYYIVAYYSSNSTYYAMKAAVYGSGSGQRMDTQSVSLNSDQTQMTTTPGADYQWTFTDAAASSESSFFSSFMGSLRYYYNAFDATDPADMPTVVQALVVKVYNDRVELHMKNYNQTGNNLNGTGINIADTPTPYTSFRTVAHSEPVEYEKYVEEEPAGPSVTLVPANGTYTRGVGGGQYPWSSVWTSETFTVDGKSVQVRIATTNNYINKYATPPTYLRMGVGNSSTNTFTVTVVSDAYEYDGLTCDLLTSSVNGVTANIGGTTYTVNTNSDKQSASLSASQNTFTITGSATGNNMIDFDNIVVKLSPVADTPTCPVEVGKCYYIYNDNYNQGADVKYYLNYNGSALGISNGKTESTAYMWRCEQSGSGYAFRNVATGTYMGWQAMSNTAYTYTVGNSSQQTGFYTLKGAEKYLVIPNNGSKFDQSSHPNYAKKTSGFSADFQFEEAVEPETKQVKIAYSTGSFAGSGNYRSSWTSTVTDPQVTVQAKSGSDLVNNMYPLSTKPDAFINYTGNRNLSNGSYSSTLNVSIPANCGYEIVGYSFNAKLYEANTTVSLTTSKGTLTLTTTDQSEEYTFVEPVMEFAFTQRGGNKGAEFSEFYVILREKEVDPTPEPTYEQYFSESFADAKWLHIYSASNSLVAMTQKGAEANNGTTIRDFNSEAQQYAFVGSMANGFAIYNKALGEQYTLTATGTSDGTPATWALNAQNPTKWYLNTSYVNAASAAGFVITTNVSSAMGLNMYGGNAGNDTKFWNASGAGSHWTIAVVSEEEEAGDSRTYLFNSTGAAHPYRIPAITKTRSGRLIAMSDYRTCGNDIGYGQVDIMARISDDNGATWGEPFYVVQGDGIDNSPTCGYGDAALVADRESDDVLLMCVSAPKNGTCWTAQQRGVVTVSPDGGLTWPKPVDIKDQICNQPTSLIPGVINYFVGSGKLHQSRYTKVGSHYRVYAALWTTPNGSSYSNYVVYTDDFGTTWNLLGSSTTPCVAGGNEPKCEELPDGSVIISSRKGAGRYYNVWTWTEMPTRENPAGVGSWGDRVEGCPSGDSSNGTDGEILIVNAKKGNSIVPVALQSMPDNGRANVSIWYKELSSDPAHKFTSSEFAGAWTKGLQVSDISSAYSTMCLQQDGRIAFYFEEGPGSYEMVYLPLTLEQITKNTYSLAQIPEQVTIGTAGAATYFFVNSVVVPEGVTVKYLTSGDANATEKSNAPGIYALTYNNIETGETVPACTAAVITGDQGTYDFLPSTEVKSSLANNLLFGYSTETPNTYEHSKAAGIFALAKPEGYAVGFYPFVGANFKAKKAYLNANAIDGITIGNGELVRGFLIIDTDDLLTDLDNVKQTEQQKGMLYDLAGRRVQNAVKGINIINGTKVVR